MSRYDVCSTELYLLLDFGTEKILSDLDLLNAQEAFDNCANRFIIDTLYLKNLYKEGPHANAILIDQEFHRIYQFEPHGNIAESQLAGEVVSEWLKTNFEKFKYYEFVPVSEVCPYVGLQAEEQMQLKRYKLTQYAGEAGYCLAWSYLFLHYCVTNPNIDPRDIVLHLLSRKDLTYMIRQYAAYLVDNFWDD